MHIPTSSLPIKFLPILLAFIFSFLLLGGCDDSTKTKKKGLSIQQKVQKYGKDTTIKGKVSNKDGAIKFGNIVVKDTKGNTIVTTELNNQSHYSLTIPAGTELPMVLTFTPDKKSTYKDKLVSVAIYTALKIYDINELTTLIAKKAESLGGYTHYNMVMAADSTVGVPDANKTSTGFKGDPTTQYGGWH